MLKDLNIILYDFIDVGFKMYDEIRLYFINYGFEGEIFD